MPETGIDFLGFLSFYDVDARAELLRMPLETAKFCPRIGEHVEVGRNIEEGGGMYLVVDVRHALVDVHDLSGQRSVISGVSVHLKPDHTDAEEHLTSAVELRLEEVAAIPIPTEPFTA
jgi:hypothetical protein